MRILKYSIADLVPFYRMVTFEFSHNALKLSMLCNYIVYLNYVKLKGGGGRARRGPSKNTNIRGCARTRLPDFTFRSVTPDSRWSHLEDNFTTIILPYPATFYLKALGRYVRSKFGMFCVLNSCYGSESRIFLYGRLQ